MSKGHVLKAYCTSNSDPGHTHLKQQHEKNSKINFASPSEKDDEKKNSRNRKATAKSFALNANVKKLE